MKNENMFPCYFAITVPTVSQLTDLTLKGRFTQLCTEFILGSLGIGEREGSRGIRVRGWLGEGPLN